VWIIIEKRLKQAMTQHPNITPTLTDWIIHARAATSGKCLAVPMSPMISQSLTWLVIQAHEVSVLDQEARLDSRV
jgi:hypothetical protein